MFSEDPSKEPSEEPSEEPSKELFWFWLVKIVKIHFQKRVVLRHFSVLKDKFIVQIR